MRAECESEFHRNQTSNHCTNIRNREENKKIVRRNYAFVDLFVCMMFKQKYIFITIKIEKSNMPSFGITMVVHTSSFSISLSHSLFQKN